MAELIAGFKVNRSLALLGFMACCFIGAFGRCNADPSETSVDFYIETYGAVASRQDPKVRTAQEVFERVRAAADKSGRRTPRLVIIDGATNAWAIALPSGHIVLSRKGLELCFKDASPALAKTRLAFILGHELAHLAHDDYWHNEVEQFLARTPDTQRIAHFLDQSFEAREAELAADDKGYLYAAIAGYPVARLLDTSRDKKDFFTFWMQQTQSQVTSSHPFPEDRAALLRERFRMLQEKVAFFDMGVRLAYFDRCDDGMYFLREFQQVFSGPAVLNNLGVCALQLARRAMSSEQAGFYWLPFLLDVDTRVPRVRGGGSPAPSHHFLREFSNEASAKVSSYLHEAADYLGQAVSVAPDYLPARLNLATVQLYLGRPHQARATLAAARSIDGEDWQVRMLDAIALYEQSDVGVDLWPAAVKRLESFSGDMTLPWRYNLARLLELRPRRQEADIHWQRLAEMDVQLPSWVRRQVCSRSLPPQVKACQEAGRLASKIDVPSWKWPVTSLEPLPLTPGMRRRLFAGWESIPFDWYRAKLYGFIHRAPDHQAEVMEMDQFVQLQVTRQGLPDDVASLARICPQSLKHYRTLRGEVVVCDHWAVLVQEGRPIEAWWIAS